MKVIYKVVVGILAAIGLAVVVMLNLDIFVTTDPFSQEYSSQVSDTSDSNKQLFIVNIALDNCGPIFSQQVVRVVSIGGHKEKWTLTLRNYSDSSQMCNARIQWLDTCKLEVDLHVEYDIQVPANEVLIINGVRPIDNSTVNDYWSMSAVVEVL